MRSAQEIHDYIESLYKRIGHHKKHDVPAIQHLKKYMLYRKSCNRHAKVEAAEQELFNEYSIETLHKMQKSLLSDHGQKSQNGWPTRNALDDALNKVSAEYPNDPQLEENINLFDRAFEMLQAALESNGVTVRPSFTQWFVGQINEDFGEPIIKLEPEQCNLRTLRNEYIPKWKELDNAAVRAQSEEIRTADTLSKARDVSYDATINILRSYKGKQKAYWETCVEELELIFMSTMDYRSKLNKAASYIDHALEIHRQKALSPEEREKEDKQREIDKAEQRRQDKIDKKILEAEYLDDQGELLEEYQDTEYDLITSPLYEEIYKYKSLYHGLEIILRDENLTNEQKIASLQSQVDYYDSHIEKTYSRYIKSDAEIERDWKNRKYYPTQQYRDGVWFLNSLSLPHKMKIRLKTESKNSLHAAQMLALRAGLLSDDGYLDIEIVNRMDNASNPVTANLTSANAHTVMAKITVEELSNHEPVLSTVLTPFDRFWQDAEEELVGSNLKFSTKSPEYFLEFHPKVKARAKELLEKKGQRN